MTTPVSTITIFPPGRESAIKFVNGHLKERAKDEVSGDIVRMKRDEALPPGELKPPETEAVNGEKSVSRFGSELADGIFPRLPEAEGLKGNGNAFVKEPTDKFLGFTEHEESVQDTLKVVSDVLHRAYHRRTNVSCWILYLTLKSFGFDDYEPVKRILTFDPEHPKDTEKFAGFVRKYAEYIKLKDDFPEQAKKFVEEKFKDKKEQKLVGLVSFVLNITDRFPKEFINNFPFLFSIQNLAMPLLANLKKEGFFGKLFNFMRMINPWIGDFLAEQIGNFKNEFLQIKEGIESIQDPFKDTKLKPNQVTDKSEIIDEVNITDLSKEQFNLKKVVRTVNDVFDRLFGRQTTISSWILNGILRFVGKHSSYQAFAKQFTEDDSFIKNLHEHLMEAGKCLKEGKKEPELDKEKFSGIKYHVAGIFYYIVSIANTLTEGFIKKSTNIFGSIFSVQNLFMPILSEFITKGKAATCIHILRDVNPLLNDIIDYMANYRKEILDVKKEKEKIDSVLPTFTKKMALSTLRKALNGVGALGRNIIELSKRVLRRAPKAMA